MKKTLCLILLICSLPVFAEQRQVKVRLFSALSPSSIRIVPRTAAAIDGTPMNQPVDIKVIAGRLVVEGKTALKSTVRISGSFAIETPGNAPVRLQQPVDIGIQEARLRILVSEPLEDYVAAVLAGEAGTFKSDESLKAMAVAIRTFAVRFDGRHAGEGFDFCDTTHCQDFRISAVTDRLRSAVESTEGEILWFNGKPAGT